MKIHESYADYIKVELDQEEIETAIKEYAARHCKEHLSPGTSEIVGGHVPVSLIIIDDTREAECEITI